MASFQVILLIIGCVQSSNNAPRKQKIKKGDHVVIDGVNEINGHVYSNKIGVVGITNLFHDKIPTVTVALMIQGKAVPHVVPEKLILGYFVVNASSNEKYVLSENGKDEIRQRVKEISEKMAAQRGRGPYKFISLRLGFGQIAQTYGFSGFCYAYNIAVKEFDEENKECIKCLERLRSKFMKFDYAAFRGARRSNLIFILPLNAQSETELQRRAAAQHLSNSYGQLMEHNGKDQTSYLVQSLSNPEIKLRISTEYLRQVCHILHAQIGRLGAAPTGSCKESQQDSVQLMKTVPSVATSESSSVEANVGPSESTSDSPCESANLEEPVPTNVPMGQAESSKEEQSKKEEAKGNLEEHEETDKDFEEKVAYAVAMGCAVSVIITYFGLASHAIYQYFKHKNDVPDVDIFSAEFIEKQKRIFEIEEAEMEKRNKTADIALAKLRQIKYENRENPLTLNELIGTWIKQMKEADTLKHD